MLKCITVIMLLSTWVGKKRVLKTFVYNRQLLISQILPSVLYNLKGQGVSYERFNSYRQKRHLKGQAPRFNKKKKEKISTLKILQRT